MASNISDFGMIPRSIQVCHIEAVGHGRSSGRVSCNGNIATTAGNITAVAGNIVATAGSLQSGKTTNQIILGTTNTVTINSAAPAASRVLTIADPLLDCRIMTSVRPTASFTALTTLTAAQSGGLIRVGGTGPYTVTLPAFASSAGLSYEIVVGSTIASGAITIAAGSAVIQGVITCANATANTIMNGTARSNIILGTTSVVGDNFRLTCDGTNWFLVGATQLNNSVTVS